MTDTTRRPPRPQTVLEVVGREILSPHLVRLHLGGKGFGAFTSNAFTDRYVKIFFAAPELGLEPPYDLAALRAVLAPEQLPVSRTYTIRRVDQAAGSLAIDFVVHGDEGIAGPWAASATVGERVVFAGPGGGYAPDPTADWHLFAGDESALPAIAAALEQLPDDARGIAFLEIGGSDDELRLAAPAGVDIRWLHRGSAPAGTSNVLADTIDASRWHPGRVHAFVHGEREAVKALRDILFQRRGLERAQVSISGYWAYGRTEERFQAEKREPIGQILP